MGTEIERKFLLKDDSWRGQVRERALYRQAYLHFREQEYGVLRVRVCAGPVVEKYRNIVPNGDDCWEIDEFLGENSGLILAELELPSEDAVFASPPWLGREVTGQMEYYNSYLARNPYRTWKNRI